MKKETLKQQVIRLEKELKEKQCEIDILKEFNKTEELIMGYGFNAMNVSMSSYNYDTRVILEFKWFGDSVVSKDSLDTVLDEKIPTSQCSIVFPHIDLYKEFLTQLQSGLDNANKKASTKTADERLSYMMRNL